MNNATNIVMEIFKKYDPCFDRWGEKIICDIDNDFTVVELFDLYKDQKLYESFFVELWSISDDKWENRFLLYIEHENKIFRIAYSFPFDKNENRNHSVILTMDDLLDLPIKNASISRIEFYFKVDRPFIRTNISYPKLGFVRANIHRSERFGTGGISYGEAITNFKIVDSKNKRFVYTIEYNKTDELFSLLLPDETVIFACIFKDKWHYSYQEKIYDDFESLFEAMGLGSNA